ncbi:MAG TPA: C_GCAxxG_C_C family protein [Candidatus Scatomorpha intestinavium]|uniref:C_GCAxxG_C_C family protein n=1 Tax=Candidatus Scatomorpha intestinavium TaxID=2840922 RepID=A0A9D0ZHS4_9FIRM|nr:C_GCAxxG_C_C family protein [Candidatus Scatomorpha intestinavium]
MNYGEKALEFRQRGCNCAQSTLCALSGRIGLDTDTARRLSAGLGGGLRAGEACGAYCGAVLAISMALAEGEKAGEPDAPLAGWISDFAKGFKEQFGAIRCADLMEKNGGDKSVCRQYMAYCAENAAGIIDGHEGK